jgi:hypothetical protein
MSCHHVMMLLLLLLLTTRRGEGLMTERQGSRHARSGSSTGRGSDPSSIPHLTVHQPSRVAQLDDGRHSTG